MRMRTWWIATTALLLAMVGGTAAHAQSVDAQRTFTLAPGGKATIDFESFCIDYGKKFPSQVGLPPTNVADPTVTGALNNALTKDYTTSNPKEVQFALWKARGATSAPQPTSVGNEIAQNLQQPTAPAGATSLIDAIAANQIKLTAGSWQGIGEKLTIGSTQDNFQGRGQLTVENTSGQSLTLYMPIGTVFPAPTAEFQSMASYLTNVNVENAQQTMPDTGSEDGAGERLLLYALLALNLAAIGILFQGRARTQR